MAEGGRVVAVVLLATLMAGVALAPAPFILVDYPNHLARAHIFAHLGDVAGFAEVYARKSGPVPYAGMDWLLVPLTRWAGAEAAGQAFIIVALLAVSGGTLALQRVVLGRPRWEALALLLVLFNYSLAWGNINYLLGLGLTLFATAAWMASARWPVVPRLALFGAVAAVLYLTHLIAVGLYALLVGGMALGEAWRRRDRASLVGIALAAAPLLVPVTLWLAQPHATRTMAVAYGPLLDHLMALLSPFSFDLWMGRFDSATAAVDWTIALLALVAVGVAVRSRRVTIAPSLRAPLVLGAVLLLLLPKTLWGIWGLHLRLPLVLAVVAIAGLTVHWPSRRVATAVAAVVLALFAARLATVVPQMVSCRAPIAALRTALQALPPGSRLLTVLDKRQGMDNGLCKPWQGFSHLAALAVIDRQAVVPLLFSENTALDYRPPWRLAGDAKTVSPAQLAAGVGLPLPAEATAPTYWHGWPQRYDHVLWLHFGAPVAAASSPLDLLHRGGYFDLFRVRP